MDKKNLVTSFDSLAQLNIEKDRLIKLGIEYRDLLPEQLNELTEIYSFTKEKITEEDKIGVLVQYPKFSIALRILPKNSFLSLLTSRNRNLITNEEQKKFQDISVGIAGLSVGSNICTTLTMQGGPQKINIADLDVLATSNLNRVALTLLDVGTKKADAIRDKMLSINPYCQINTYDSGIDVNNVKEFIDSSDIIFDEIDNIPLKIMIRELSKKARKPVVMITDNGDNIMVDIERYDTEPKLEILHGLLSKKDVQHIKKRKNKLTPLERVTLSLKIVGAENAVPKMQLSLLEVGKSLNTWPQLGTASGLAGSIGSIIVRKIANIEGLNSGRLHVNVDDVLVPGYSSNKNIKLRKQSTKDFLNKLTKF